MLVSRTKWASVCLVAGLAAGTTQMAAAQQDPVMGGTLRIATQWEPAGVDPIFGNSPAPDKNLYNMFYENLFYPDATGTRQPLLATSWEIAPDGKTVTMQLQQGVMFHDGTAFDAEAAKFNLERAADQEIDSIASPLLKQIEGVDVVNDHAIRINLRDSSADFTMGVLERTAGMMVSPKAVQDLGEELKRRAVGSGPFEFVEWVGKTRMIVEKFDGYWRKDAAGRQLPYLDRIEVKFVGNTAVKLLEARSGNVDLTDSVQVKDFQQVLDSPNLKLLDNPSGQHYFLAFNTASPPFDNKDLRFAVTHAIDRAAMARVITGEYGIVTPTMEPPSSWAYSETLEGHKYDPELAREYLEKSGFDGRLLLTVIQRDPDSQIAPILQAQLAAVGINAQIEVLERQAYVRKLLRDKPPTHEFAVLQTAVPGADPGVFFASVFGKGGGFNVSVLSDEWLWDMVAKAGGRPTREQRKADYVAIQQHVLDQAYNAFLFNRPLKDVAAANLNGFEYENYGPWRLEKVWLSK